MTRGNLGLNLRTTHSYRGGHFGVRPLDGVETFFRHLASSANRKIFESNQGYRRGPKILPCGTPEITGRESEIQ